MDAILISFMILTSSLDSVVISGETNPKASSLFTLCPKPIELIEPICLPDE